MVVIGIVVYLVGAFLAAIVYGWALATLWGWFIVPFFALPALSIPQAIGVSLAVGLLVKDPQPPNDEENGVIRAFSMLITSLLRGPLIVAMGWIVRLFL